MIVATIIFLVASVLVYRHKLNPGMSEPLFATLLFAPTVIFLVLEGKVQELSGFGLKASFAEAAQSPLDDAFELGIDALAVPAFTDIRPDSEAAFWEGCGTVYVIRTNLIPDSNGPDAVGYLFNAASTLRASLLCGGLEAAIVLDERDRYLGTFEPEFFQESLALGALRAQGATVREIASYVDDTIFGAALWYPEVRVESGEGYRAAIHEDKTLREAHDRFSEIAGDVLVVTTAEGIAVGLLTRAEVQAAMLRAALDSLDGTG